MRNQNSMEGQNPRINEVIKLCKKELHSWLHAIKVLRRNDDKTGCLDNTRIIGTIELPLVCLLLYTRRISQDLRHI